MSKGGPEVLLKQQLEAHIQILNAQLAAATKLNVDLTTHNRRIETEYAKLFQALEVKVAELMALVKEHTRDA